MIRKTACILSFSFFLSFQLSAQEEKESWVNWEDSAVVNLSRPLVKQFLELGVSANTYRGDLSTYQKFTSCFHVALKFNQARKINGRIGISSGFITGDNRLYTFRTSEGLASPNTFFKTNLISFDFELQYNLIKTRQWIVYLSQGIGLNRINVKDKNGESLLNNLDTRAAGEAYTNFVFSLPTGIGAMYIFKNGYAFGTQAQFLNTTSDYLDNISAWSVKTGSDNIFRLKFSFFAPLRIIPNKLIPPARFKKSDYSHH